MRIGVDIKAFKNGSTGIARYLRSILDELQVLDRENDYVLFSCAPSDYPLVNSRWNKIVTPWRLPGIFWQQLVLPKLLKQHRIELLWAPEQVCPIHLEPRIKIVTTVYDLTFLLFPKTCVWSNRWIQKILFPLTISRSDIIAPISNYIGREVNRWYPRRMHMKTMVTVPCSGQGWAPPENYDPVNRGDFLFFIGNLEPRKNLIRLIKALELLHNRNGMTIPLHLAGPKGWKNKILYSLITNSPIRDSIHHLGFLTEEQIQQEYLSCKALVYPSLYEGFGIPVLEAFSLNCLVLTSHGTVMQEIAGNAALFFDPQDVESIAEKIKSIYTLEFNYDLYVQKGKTVNKCYSWRRSSAILYSLFQSLS